MPDEPASPGVTQLLIDWSNGDENALQQLIPLVHDELRRVARRHMARERAEHTLQATALVNEAYMRLIDIRRVRWQNRAHFFAMSARLMRRISPDGRWFAYESTESGREEIHVRPFPDVNAGRWQVSSAGGRQPLWARNGKELFVPDHPAAD